MVKPPATWISNGRISTVAGGRQEPTNRRTHSVKSSSNTCVDPSLLMTSTRFVTELARRQTSIMGGMGTNPPRLLQEGRRIKLERTVPCMNPLNGMINVTRGGGTKDCSPLTRTSTNAVPGEPDRTRTDSAGDTSVPKSVIITLIGIQLNGKI